MWCWILFPLTLQVVLCLALSKFFTYALISIVLNAPRDASRGFLESSHCWATYITVPILWMLYASISPDLHVVLGSGNQPCFSCLPHIEPQPGHCLKAVSWDTRRIHCFISCLLDIPALLVDIPYHGDCWLFSFIWIFKVLQTSK